MPNSTSQSKSNKTFKLTGWHFLAIMLSFFAVIVMVNIVFVTRALNAFSGLVVKNSYVASQFYNEKIEQAEKQKQLNWDLDLLVTGKGADFILKDKDGKPISKKLITLQLRMNKNTKADMALILNEQSAGHYFVAIPQPKTRPDGSWLITLEILQNNELFYHYEETRAIKFSE